MRLEEIRKRYNISGNDLEEMKAQLKIKIKEIHPDSGHDFDSAYFSQLCDDLTYVENLIRNSENQNTLVPISEVLQTLAGILQTPARKDEDDKEVLNKKISENIQDRLMITKKHLKTSKIGSTTIAAVITFLWMFPNQVIEHPLIQMLFGDDWLGRRIFILIITIIWLYALLFAIGIWLRSIRIEKIAKDIMERSKLESVQNEIFMSYLSFIYPDKQFSKSHFMEYLAHSLNGERKQRKILHFLPEEEIIQNVAGIVLLRAKEQGIIQTIKSNSLIECYEIVQDE